MNHPLFKIGLVLNHPHPLLSFLLFLVNYQYAQSTAIEEAFGGISALAVFEGIESIV